MFKFHEVFHMPLNWFHIWNLKCQGEKRELTANVLIQQTRISPVIEIQFNLFKHKNSTVLNLNNFIYHYFNT